MTNLDNDQLCMEQRARIARRREATWAERRIPKEAAGSVPSSGYTTLLA